MEEAGSNTIIYWKENNSKEKKQAHGRVKTYKFYNYTSGYIHHCNLKNLEVILKFREKDLSINLVIYI